MKISDNRLNWFSLWAGLLLSCFSISLQAQGQKPQTISSAPSEVTITLRPDNGILRLNGKAVFKPTEGNSDDTLTGELVYEISEGSRRLLAQQLKKPLAEIPDSVIVKEVVALFEKHAKCPELRFDVTEITFAIIGLAGRTGRFKLVVPETEHELSKLLCLWARRIESGRGTRGMATRFNRLAKSEKEGQ